MQNTMLRNTKGNNTHCKRPPFTR